MSPAPDEQRLSLKEAAALFPGHPTRSTIDRWIHRGVRGIRLATILVGGRRFTTREAIDQFIAALSKQEGSGDAA